MIISELATSTSIKESVNFGATRVKQSRKPWRLFDTLLQQATVDTAEMSGIKGVPFLYEKKWKCSSNNLVKKMLANTTSWHQPDDVILTKDTIWHKSLAFWSMEGKDEFTSTRWTIPRWGSSGEAYSLSMNTRVIWFPFKRRKKTGMAF